VDYKDYNDFELINYIAEENEEAFDILMTKYKPIVDIIVRKKLILASMLNIEYQDLYQEGMIGLMEAVRDFKNKPNVTFYTFASLCIERQINSAILKYNRKKNIPLNTSISLDATLEETGRNLLDVIDSKNISPEEFIVESEEELELYRKIKDTLSVFEEQVFELKIANFTYEEIAHILDVDQKTVYNAMERIKGKVKKQMNQP